MYKTILTPLDGSKRAESILKHVEELARRFDAKVVFLQVIEPNTFIVGHETAFYVQYKEEVEKKNKQAEVYLAGIKGEFREKGIESRVRVVNGPIVDAIIAAAESENVDLIAIASHGRSGLSRVFYGSVAAGILNRADRPLLLIRSR
jgi:nucleotide-binding universal stress UspA family protein